jgi:hypothetical protein
MSKGGWYGLKGVGGGAGFWVLVCFHGVIGMRSPSRSWGVCCIDLEEGRCARRLDDILLYGLPRGGGGICCNIRRL